MSKARTSKAAASDLLAAMASIPRNHVASDQKSNAATKRRTPCPLPKLTPQEAEKRFQDREEVILKQRIWLPSQHRVLRPRIRLRVDGINADWLVTYGYADRVSGRDTGALDVSSDHRICEFNRGPGEWWWHMYEVQSLDEPIRKVVQLLYIPREDEDVLYTRAYFIQATPEEVKEDEEIGFKRTRVGLHNDPDTPEDPAARKEWRRIMRLDSFGGRIEGAHKILPMMAGFPEAVHAAETLKKLDRIADRMGPRGQIAADDALLAQQHLEKFHALVDNWRKRKRIREWRAAGAKTGRAGGLAKAASVNDRGERTRADQIRALLATPEFREMSRTSPRQVARVAAERLGVSKVYIRRVRSETKL